MKHHEDQRTELGLKLAEARKNKGLTLQSVGETLGYKAAKQTVGHWETGHSVPDALVLVALSRLYEVDPNELLGIESIKDNQWRALAHGMANGHPKAEMRGILSNFCDLVDAQYSAINKPAEPVKKSLPKKVEG